MSSNAGCTIPDASAEVAIRSISTSGSPRSGPHPCRLKLPCCLPRQHIRTTAGYPSMSASSNSVWCRTCLQSGALPQHVMCLRQLRVHVWAWEVLNSSTAQAFGIVCLKPRPTQSKKLIQAVNIDASWHGSQEDVDRPPRHSQHHPLHVCKGLRVMSTAFNSVVWGSFDGLGPGF